MDSKVLLIDAGTPETEMKAQIDLAVMEFNSNAFVREMTYEAARKKWVVLIVKGEPVLPSPEQLIVTEGDLTDFSSDHILVSDELVLPSMFQTLTIIGSHGQLDGNGVVNTYTPNEEESPPTGPLGLNYGCLPGAPNPCIWPAGTTYTATIGGSPFVITNGADITLTKPVTPPNTATLAAYVDTAGRLYTMFREEGGLATAGPFTFAEAVALGAL